MTLVVKSAFDVLDGLLHIFVVLCLPSSKWKFIYVAYVYVLMHNTQVAKLLMDEKRIKYRKKSRQQECTRLCVKKVKKCYITCTAYSLSTSSKLRNFQTEWFLVKPCCTYIYIVYSYMEYSRYFYWNCGLCIKIFCY